MQAELEPRLWSSTAPAHLDLALFLLASCLPAVSPRAPVWSPENRELCSLQCRPVILMETVTPSIACFIFQSPSQRALPHPLPPPQKRSQVSFITPTSHKVTSSFLSGQRPKPITQWEGGQGLGMVPLNPSTQQTDIRELEANPVDTEGNQASHDFRQYLPQTMLCGFLPDA